jgi:hypothetical protein
MFERDSVWELQSLIAVTTEQSLPPPLSKEGRIVPPLAKEGSWVLRSVREALGIGTLHFLIKYNCSDLGIQ